MQYPASSSGTMPRSTSTAAAIRASSTPPPVAPQLFGVQMRHADAVRVPRRPRVHADGAAQLAGERVLPRERVGARFVLEHADDAPVVIFPVPGLFHDDKGRHPGVCARINHLRTTALYARSYAVPEKLGPSRIRRGHSFTTSIASMFNAQSSVGQSSLAFGGIPAACGFCAYVRTPAATAEPVPSFDTVMSTPIVAPAVPSFNAAMMKPQSVIVTPSSAKQKAAAAAAADAAAAATKTTLSKADMDAIAVCVRKELQAIFKALAGK